MNLESYHDEVVAALRAIGNPEYGERVRKDRGSSLEHLGIGFPALRARVKQGFSFTSLRHEETLEIWDGLFRTSPYGDVLFAALEFYLPIARKRVPDEFWPVASGWIERIDNWCHADLLGSLYSWILATDHETVYPQLEIWNGSDSEWKRRISLVSLIHYSGKNAVFLPPEKVLPLVSNCLQDRRHYVQTAVGWVLREMSRLYPYEIEAFVGANSAMISKVAVRRLRS